MRNHGSRPLALLAMSLVAAVALAASPAGASSPPEADARLRTSAPMARRVVTAPGLDRPTTASVRPAAEASARTTFRAVGPTTVFSFDAIGRIGGNWPADPTGAVSDTWYFTAVNTHYALYDLTGAEALGPTSFGGLFNLPAGTQVFDPKVVYDPYGDTFVLAFLGVNDAQQQSWILVVTIPDATADQRSTWCGTKIGADRTSGDGKQWPDYPGLGFSGDRVTISTNQFDFSGGAFASAQILSFPKGNLYDCSQKVTFDTFAGSDTRNPSGTQAFTILPAISAGSSPGSQFLVSLDEGKPASLVVWRIKPSADGLSMKRAALPLGGKVSIAPYGTQCNGSLQRSDTWWDPGDLRFVTAFYDADHERLFAAHPIAKDIGPDPQTGGYVESVIRWYDVRPATKLAGSDIMRRGVIGEPESDVGWPALATDVDGNLIVAYSQASAPNDECLSARAAQVLRGRTAASTVLLVPGEARTEAIKGPERWGDYAAAVRDPVDGTRVVLIDQYAAADGGQTTIDWQQIVYVLTAG